VLDGGSAKAAAGRSSSPVCASSVLPRRRRCDLRQRATRWRRGKYVGVTGGFHGGRAASSTETGQPAQPNRRLLVGTPAPRRCRTVRCSSVLIRSVRLEPRDGTQSSRCRTTLESSSWTCSHGISSARPCRTSSSRLSTSSDQARRRSSDSKSLWRMDSRSCSASSARWLGSNPKACCKSSPFEIAIRLTIEPVSARAKRPAASSVRNAFGTPTEARFTCRALGEAPCPPNGCRAAAGLADAARAKPKHPVARSVPRSTGAVHGRSVATTCWAAVGIRSCQMPEAETASSREPRPRRSGSAECPP